MKHSQGSPPSPFGHLTVDELAAYHEERLEPAAVERIELHLDHCESCAELLADFAEFGPTADPAERAEGRAAADRLLTRIRDDRWKRRAALAASLLIVAVGGLFWGTRRAGPIPELEVTPGVRGSAAEIVLPASAQRFVLVILGVARDGREPWRLSAVDSHGEVIRLRDLKPDTAGSLRVELAARPFPSGLYRFRIEPDDAALTGEPLEFDLIVRRAS